MASTETADEYERIVERLLKELAPRSGVLTEGIERDVRVRGRSTTNQIDVLWDFTDAKGARYRVAFEARAYGRRIDQGKLHAFRSVVDDIQDPDRPVFGVMVTTTGYQSGAAHVASTYGLVVLDLRRPTADDLAGRVHTVQIEITAQMPVMQDIRFDAVEVHDPDAAAAGFALAGDVEIVPAGQSPRALPDVLLAGELGELGSPRDPHSVRREFSPPADLLIEGRRVASVAAVSATVGDAVGEPLHVTVGGLKDVAWMVRDALSGARAWIADGGEIWFTDS